MAGKTQTIKVKGGGTATVTTNSDGTRSVSFSNNTGGGYGGNTYSGKIGGNTITNNTTGQTGTISGKGKNSTISWSDNNNNNKNKNINLSNMSFGKDVYSAGGGYDLAGRNKQIVDIMKNNGIQATNAKSVQDFLEMYSDSYKKADDNDKLNTADKIYKLYNGIPEFDTNDDSPLNDTEDWDLENYMNDEFNVGDEENNEVDERDEQIKQLQDELLSYKEREADELNNQLDILNNKEENKGLTDEQKEANIAASSAAWNAAQGGNNAENAQVETPDTTPQNTQTLINSENYGDRGTKILGILSNLGYKLNNAPSEQSADNEVSNIMEGGEEVKPAEEQIAESNKTNGAITPEYSDEEGLVTSYNQEFDKLLEGGITPDNIQKAVQTYLQAKDAAALFTVQNNLSDEAYLNMLKKIKGNNSLRVLLQNYNK